MPVTIRANTEISDFTAERLFKKLRNMAATIASAESVP
jgi:hypothetical protein